MISVPPKNAGESAKDYVIRVLIDNIINTRLAPGEKLLEQELCEKFQVSRTPFREAELALAGRRLIDIRPKIGTYVSYIDASLVEEVRHLRSVLESELAVMACRLLTREDMDRLWENLAIWQLYIRRRQEEKIFLLDKEFHSMLYHMCGRVYWYELAESVSPHFDRTTILSFRCKPMEHILQDHEDLIKAIEARDEEQAAKITRRHLERYSENIHAILEAFPDYFRR